MKKYILRAPETDRKKVLVPEVLADLTDGFSPAHGVATRSTDQVIAHFTFTDLVLTTGEELSNVTLGSNGLVFTVGGLYQINYELTWKATYPTTAQQWVDTDASLPVLAYASGVDALTGRAAGSGLLRFAAGAELRIGVVQTDGVSRTIANARLTVFKVAP
jgi:hypothetical protein